MISARIIILFFLIFSLIWKLNLERLEEKQYKKPLPREVADVYDSEKYAKFRAYKADNKRFSHIETIISTAIDLFILFSPYYKWMENLAGRSPYALTFWTYFIFWAISTVLSIVFSYYDTFHIEAKYDMNKKTPKEFAKDEILDMVQSFIISFALLMLVTWIITSLPRWTNGFAISVQQAVIFAIIVIAIFFVVIVLASLFQILVLTKQYTFTKLPEGELRDKIMALQDGVKRPITRIHVYNESKKSPRKNAFMFKFLWFKAFGIADNFLNENSERELLGVLSHEIGHLKHKKNLLNYLNYLLFVVVLLILVALLLHPAALSAVNAWVSQSFSITTLNVSLYIMLLGYVIYPIGIALSAWQNFRSRREEKEADMEAVKNGYGQELINTFKRLSSDELIDVNPHPFIEAATYDHPGMATRIRYIEAAMMYQENLEHKKAPEK